MTSVPFQRCRQPSTLVNFRILIRFLVNVQGQYPTVLYSGCCIAAAVLLLLLLLLCMAALLLCMAALLLCMAAILLFRAALLLRMLSQSSQNQAPLQETLVMYVLFMACSVADHTRRPCHADAGADARRGDLPVACMVATRSSCYHIAPIAPTSRSFRPFRSSRSSRSPLFTVSADRGACRCS